MQLVIEWLRRRMAAVLFDVAVAPPPAPDAALRPSTTMVPWDGTGAGCDTEKEVEEVEEDLLSVCVAGVI